MIQLVLFGAYSACHNRIIFIRTTWKRSTLSHDKVKQVAISDIFRFPCGIESGVKAGVLGAGSVCVVSSQ